jgi:hypothetical protein
MTPAKKKKIDRIPAESTAFDRVWRRRWWRHPRSIGAIASAVVTARVLRVRAWPEPTGDGFCRMPRRSPLIPFPGEARDRRVDRDQASLPAGPSKRFHAPR